MNLVFAGGNSQPIFHFLHHSDIWCSNVCCHNDYKTGKLVSYSDLNSLIPEHNMFYLIPSSLSEKQKACEHHAFLHLVLTPA